MRRRVFSSELSDVFDNKAPESWRLDFWDLVASTPDLDWMVLSKRPQNFRKMLPAGWPWRNVWLGVTGENQREWNRRTKLLISVPATIRFVSVEPMLGPLQIDPDSIDWVICGGETVKYGQKNDDGTPAVARFMDPNWARDLRDQWRLAGVPFFLKQMTNKAPIPDDLLIREFPV